MPFLLNGVGIGDLRVNGTQVDRAYLNGVEVYTRIQIGDILPDGGIVFGQEGGDWLVVAPASQRRIMRWGLINLDTSLPNVGSGSPPNDPNSSKYNTDVLTSPTYSSVTSGGSLQERVTGAPAAEHCRSIGYDLPNAKDLQLIYNNRTQIDALDSSGDLPAGTYIWSSSESGSSNAWRLYGTATWQKADKYGGNWVIPFKRIPA